MFHDFLVLIFYFAAGLFSVGCCWTQTSDFDPELAEQQPNVEMPLSESLWQLSRSAEENDMTAFAHKLEEQLVLTEIEATTPESKPMK